MKIHKINLTDFRIYKGENIISFNPNSERNISLIAGRNGYGKTTFLTSLIWVFYGKMMSEVEDKYRNDIKSVGGYDKFLKTLLNRDVKSDFDNKLIDKAKLSVEIELRDISIPSIPCKSVVIKRSYDFKSNKEELKIFIDGLENELTKEVGYEVFINDFILPREIAKFFFFDAEKIVSLAEAKTKEELKNLSRAYSEVLGIKKYEDLKKNLESLISKLKRTGASPTQQTKLVSLLDDENEINGLIEINDNNLLDIESELQTLKTRSEGLQEKLIREGNAITLTELQAFKKERDILKNESIEIKQKLKKLLDIAPLVIAGPAFHKLKNQLLAEQKNNTASHNHDSFLDELKNFSESIISSLKSLNIDNELQRKIDAEILKSLSEKESLLYTKGSVTKVLVDFSIDQFREFEAIVDNIKGAFSNQFAAVVQEEKTNRILLTRIVQKIRQAEARQDNPLAQKLREEKINIDSKAAALQTEKGKILAENENLHQRLASTRKVLSEYEKNLKIADIDTKKYDVAVLTLEKINSIIQKIKEDKKYSLQKSLLLGLNKIMHKKDFVHDIRINVYEDVMDIDLIDNQGQIIEKDSLSKGEQQLYATALLKALVEESGIKFPVFIDSPLQKFDKYHSKNIIQEFYPSISEQVVLFPLLEKELSEKEFDLLKENINQVYLIENKINRSVFVKADINKLFEQLNLEDNVYAN
jgi:DNA sulfur modification protein DndD